MSQFLPDALICQSHSEAINKILWSDSYCTSLLFIHVSFSSIGNTLMFEQNLTLN
jgi:hypothetical protein